MTHHSEQDAWEHTVPRAITSDVIWKLDAYRAALFLLHVAKGDARRALAGGLDREIAAQLIRSVGSVSANISEGYSRPTRADRLRFYGYALGSTRECVTWYLAADDSPDTSSQLDARLTLIARTRALLLGMIRSARTQGSRKREREFEP
jgi:four helix bundle protein